MANGGATVEDYRVTYDQSSDDYVVLASALNLLTYTAIGLTAGNTYKFKVEARNSYGYSSYSDVIAILCASNPEQPAPATTTVVGNQVVIDWSRPIENGTPVTGYNIYFR